MSRSLVLVVAALFAFAASLPAAEAPKGPALSRLTYEYLFLAEALMRHHRYGEAREELAGLLKRVKGNDYETAVVLQTWAYAELGDGDYAAAARRLGEALAVGALPQSVAHPLRFTLAQLYLQQDRPKDAVRVLETWLAAEKAPDPEAHVLAAQVYGALERWDPAIRHARKALDGTRNPPESRYRLLLALQLQAGRRKEAAAFLEDEILPRFPDDPAHWRQLAGLALDLGQEERAAAVLALADRRGILGPADLRRLAQLYLRLEAPLRAAALLERVLKDPAAKAGAADQRLLADAWQLAREPERALAALERAGEARDRLRAGELLLDLGRLDEAEKQLRRALVDRETGRDGRAHLLLGMALLRLGDPDAAREALAAALERAGSERVREETRRWLAYLDGAR